MNLAKFNFLKKFVY